MLLSGGGAVVVSVCCFMNTQRGIIREVSPVKDRWQVNIVQSSIMNRDNEILVNEDMIRNFKRLDEFAALEKDWDGYDAAPLPLPVIDAARGIVRHLFRQPCLFPTAADTIQLEYRNSSGGLFAVQIGEYGPYEGYRRDGAGKRNSFIIQPSEAIDKINKLAAEFYGQSL